MGIDKEDVQELECLICKSKMPVVEYTKELEKYDIRKIELKGEEIEKAHIYVMAVIRKLKLWEFKVN